MGCSFSAEESTAARDRRRKKGKGKKSTGRGKKVKDVSAGRVSLCSQEQQPEFSDLNTAPTVSTMKTSTTNDPIKTATASANSSQNPFSIPSSADNSGEDFPPPNPNHRTSSGIPVRIRVAKLRPSIAAIQFNLQKANPKCKGRKLCRMQMWIDESSCTDLLDPQDAKGQVEKERRIAFQLQSQVIADTSKSSSSGADLQPVLDPTIVEENDDISLKPLPSMKSATSEGED